MEERNDRFTAIEDRFSGYQVNDRDGEKIGKVDDLFVDETDRAEYIGVKMGFLGMSSTLIPMDISRVDEENQTITVDTEKEIAKNGPSFDDDQDITPEFERQVREHYGLSAREEGAEVGAYGPYYAAEEEDELRVERTEEELRAGTREREAGGVNVRKRVRTDREQVRVPKRREEVNVERVPVDEAEGQRAAAESEIGDEEVRVPVVEDEVVVEKKPVAKEEVRVRKDVVDEEKVVEEDVRKEEVDVDDQTGR